MRQLLLFCISPTSHACTILLTLSGWPRYDVSVGHVRHAISGISALALDASDEPTAAAAAAAADDSDVPSAAMLQARARPFGSATGSSRSSAQVRPSCRVCAQRLVAQGPNSPSLTAPAAALSSTQRQDSPVPGGAPR